MKKIILFCINYDHHIRNYFETDALSVLKKKYTCYFLANNEIKDKRAILKKEKNFIGFINYNKYLMKKFNRLDKIIHYITENKSSTFRFNNFGIHLNIFKNQKYSIRDLLIFPVRFFILSIKISDYIFYKYFGNEKKEINNFIKENEPNEKLKKIIKLLNPNLIIVPGQGNNILQMDVSRICRYEKKQTLFLSDNWDNTSSRRFIRPFANHIGVWGNQSKYYCKKINNFNDKNIHVIGTPRIDKYFSIIDKKIKSPFKFKYILFLESGIQDRIYEFLSVLNNLINTNVLLKKYKIVYRPHPFTIEKKFNLLKIKKLKNIIIDPDSISVFKRKKNYTNLNYYPALIKNSEIVICGPTTMIIESLILKKIPIIIAFKGNNYFNHYNAFKMSLHLQKILKSKYIQTNYTLSNINNDIMKHINKKDFKFNNKFYNFIKYFLHFDKIEYKTRLVKTVDAII
jgi:hypothetical protein